MGNILKMQQKIDISFRGEFGWELLKAIPYAYYLETKGLLGSTTGCVDTKCLYYFSKNHIELHKKRCCSGNWEGAWRNTPFESIHRHEMNCETWLTPPYKEIFKNKIFVYKKPILIISNKFNQEWGRDPVNFISLKTLLEIIKLLSKEFKIIYNRPDKKNLVEDGPANYDLKEKDELKKNGVTLIDEIFDEYKNRFTFNELQMMLFANCERFISVQGGTSILSSYFGGKNIILAKAGQEIKYKSYNWYSVLSGCDVLYTNYDSELVKFSEGYLSSAAGEPLLFSE